MGFSRQEEWSGLPLSSPLTVEEELKKKKRQFLESNISKNKYLLVYCHKLSLLSKLYSFSFEHFDSIQHEVNDDHLFKCS